MCYASQWLTEARMEESVLVQDLNEEALEVSATLTIQGIFQGYIVLLEVHFLHRLQVNLWVDGIKRVSHKHSACLFIF